MDPRNSHVVVAGSNDYCAEIGSGSGNQWPGYYRSTDGGATWRSSLVPGYPNDTSPLGSRSPTKGSCASAGDPTQAFDGSGHLYYGFICFNRAKPTNGSIYVARYDNDGASYRFTTRVERGTPSVAGLFQDKINITADQRNGNVYVAWARFSGNLGNNVIMFSRSTDGGRTYSKPIRISDGGAAEQFADLAVGPTAPSTSRTASTPARRARRDRDRQVDERGRLVDAAADGRDDHRLRVHRLRPGHVRRRAVPLPAAQLRALLEPVGGRSRRQRRPRRMERAHGAGQSRSSPATRATGSAGRGRSCDSTPRPTGHQFFPDIATDGSTLSVIFQDSRADPSYSPDRPTGNTAAGTSSGQVVDAYVARSSNGAAWTETLVSAARSNPNFENRGNARSPFFGDYNYVSAAPDGSFFTVWTDTRDLVSVHRPARRQPGRGLRRGHPDLQLGAGRHLRRRLQLARGLGSLPVTRRARPEHLRRRRVTGLRDTPVTPKPGEPVATRSVANGCHGCLSVAVAQSRVATSRPAS